MDHSIYPLIAAVIGVDTIEEFEPTGDLWTLALAALGGSAPLQRNRPLAPSMSLLRSLVFALGIAMLRPRCYRGFVFCACTNPNRPRLPPWLDANSTFAVFSSMRCLWLCPLTGSRCTLQGCPVVELDGQLPWIPNTPANCGFDCGSEVWFETKSRGK
ncbi:hypothetical protein VTK56DRAFT_6201 [Thermocarpiscus australiensis]